MDSGDHSSSFGIVSYACLLYLICSSFTSPSLPEPKYVDGFQGNDIPLDGEAVARLCYDRLTLAEEVDD
jgi:hypothetical protein